MYMGSDVDFDMYVWNATEYYGICVPPYIFWLVIIWISLLCWDKHIVKMPHIHISHTRLRILCLFFTIHLVPWV